MDIPFFSDQANLLYEIAALRSPIFDPIFLFLNYFDSEYFLMVVIPFVWIGISDRWGIRVAVLLIFSSLINYHLKLLFDMPRPIVDLPDLPMVFLTDPGFPSGGAQTATLLGGLLIYGWKSPWGWIFGLPYIALICFSRLYLGVHYPSDVLGGMLIGLALLLIFIFSIQKIDQFCKREGRAFCLLSCILFCFLYAFLIPSHRGFQLMGALLGFSVGAYAAFKFDLYPNRARSFGTRFLSSLICIIVLFVLYFLTPSYTPPGVQSTVLALWISLIAPPCCRAIMPKTKR
jgi:membrane-associated phospholipid phosphatase